MTLQWEEVPVRILFINPNIQPSASDPTPTVFPLGALFQPTPCSSTMTSTLAPPQCVRLPLTGMFIPRLPQLSCLHFLYVSVNVILFDKLSTPILPNMGLSSLPAYPFLFLLLCYSPKQLSSPDMDTFTSLLAYYCLPFCVRLGFSRSRAEGIQMHIEGMLFRENL